ncbi:hypothetical protein ACFWMG_15495 [Streptomyces sp. NPDC127074]|uniref:hypothetical protein n=1 Tax=Streptomyces sp. NPDC127074 TaxID=3347130 RepID=UPI00364659B1
MSARDELRRYVRLLADWWTSPKTTDERVERLYASVRAEVLREAADELVAHCPDHGSVDTRFIACQCLAVDDLRRTASKGGAA